MEKEDYFNLFRNDIGDNVSEENQIKSARYIIESNGKCNAINCSVCPFGYFNSLSVTQCDTNGYSTVGTRREFEDGLLLQAAMYFLEFKLGEKEPDCKLINYNFF